MGITCWMCSTLWCGAKTDGQRLVSLQEITAPPDHGHPNDYVEIKNTEFKVSV
jgi:hypothetical protein